MALHVLQRLGCLGWAVFVLSLVILCSDLALLLGVRNSSSSVPYQAIRVSLNDKTLPQEITRTSSHLSQLFRTVRSSFKRQSVILEMKEPLEDFRYPANLKITSLRLPDYYFTSSVAQQVRKPRGKLKHLSRVYTKLFVERKPIHISILGGSNSAGAGLGKSMKEVRSAYQEHSYAVKLEKWLNDIFPPKEGSHVVHNFGRGAVGSCYFLLLFEKLTDPAYLGAETDLFILETSVNDILPHDMTCFDQLVSRIVERYSDTSIISLHLATPPDFLKACNFQPSTMSNCVNGTFPGVFQSRSTGRYKTSERWCDKRGIVDKHSLLHIDLEMLLHMLCQSIPPFQHAKATTAIMNEVSAHALPGMAPTLSPKAELFKYVSSTSPSQLRREVLLLTEGSYNRSLAYDDLVAHKYKQPFTQIEREIATKIGRVDGEPGRLGDLSIFAADRMHIGRWGHLLLTAEIATWFLWLASFGKNGIEHEAKAIHQSTDKTVWAAITFDMGYYNKRSRNKATNKHKPAREDASLDIYPLRASGAAVGWRLFDDSGMQKRGLITEDPVPRRISFNMPTFNGSEGEQFVVRLGYLKSYKPNMASFDVDVHERLSNEHFKTRLTGNHKENVSVFVDSTIAVLNGTNDVLITVTSLPHAFARKVKIVALYVTKTIPKPVLV